MKRMAFAFCAALVLASCSTGGPAWKESDPLDFSDIKPVSIVAAKIEIEDHYQPQLNAPYVDYLFNPPPAVAVTELLRTKLIAAGGDKTLRVSIDDASVLDQKLPGSKGFWNSVEDAPSDKYQGKIALRFELVDPAAPDIVVAHAEVTATHSQTILKNSSPADRDQAAKELTRDLVNDVSDGLQTIVKNTFGMQ